MDQQLIYSIGGGKPHPVYAMESQVSFLRWIGEDQGRFEGKPLLLLGERRSGTSWAGLVATVSLALAKGKDAWVYGGSDQLPDTHRLIRMMLPSEWVDVESEKEGKYRLPCGAMLHVVAFTQRKKWSTSTPSIAMINDYSLATVNQLEAARDGVPHQVICGNPPLASERTRGWITRMRDQTKSAGTFFRFWTKLNQSVRGSTDAWNAIAKVTNLHVPGFLEDSPPAR